MCILPHPPYEGPNRRVSPRRVLASSLAVVSFQSAAALRAYIATLNAQHAERVAPFLARLEVLEGEPVMSGLSDPLPEPGAATVSTFQGVGAPDVHDHPWNPATRQFVAEHPEVR